MSQIDHQTEETLSPLIASKRRQHLEWLRQRTIARNHADGLKVAKEEALKLRAPQDPTTEQTKARLREGTIERLLRTGRLNKQHERAADEIERVYIAITGSMLIKPHRWERLGHTNEPERWPASLSDAYINRYWPWVDELRDRRGVFIARSENNMAPPILDVVISVVVDGHAARDIANRHRCRRPKVIDWLIEGLDLYARKAGWV